MRGLAAVFLLFFAALFALPLEAQAQTEVWTATLTIGFPKGANAGPEGYCAAGCYGDAHKDYGDLSDTTFTYSSTDYTVDSIRAGLGSDSDTFLHFTVSPKTSLSASGLTLQIGTKTYALSDASEETDTVANRVGKFNYHWDFDKTTDRPWPSPVSGDTVTVKLISGGTPPPPTLSNDATLSDLDLENNSGTGIALSPTFASGTTTYTAMVVNAVDEITIIPTVNESNATYEIQDSDGTALTDADSGEDDFQVDLSEGENEIKVEVTAQDTTTMETYEVTVTQSRRVTTTPAAPPEVTVPNDWSLIPAGVGAGDKFRLIFLSSTKTDGESYDIADYNTFIQGRAAAGHTDIRTYSSGFRAVGCTADSDATANTGTTGTGEVIYWLGGNKAADNYGDFYDGSWDDEVNDKDEDGNNGPNTSLSTNYPLTGCIDNGTEAFSLGGSSQALGAPGGFARVGRPNSSASGIGPLSSNDNAGISSTRPMYGLSQVFEVAASTNAAPTFSSTTAARSVDENTAAGQNVGSVLTATDSDGDTLTYTLEGTDAASFDLDTTTTAGSARIQTKTGVTYNHEAKSTYTVVVKADDGNSGTDTITVTITITDVDGEAPGRPAAPTVIAVTGSSTSLAVSWTAPTNTGPAIDTYDLRYQKTTESTWTNGPQDRTGTGTSIGSLDAGTAYRVQVRATSDEGDGDWSQSGAGTTGAPTNNDPTFNDGMSTSRIFNETIGNAAVAASSNIGQPITATDTDTGDTLAYSFDGGTDDAKFGIVTTSGQIQTKVGEKYDREAKASYSVTVTVVDGNGGSDTITVALNVVDQNEAPGRPAAPMVTATSGSTTSLSVSWTAPENTGRPPITDYDYRYRVTSPQGSWTEVTNTAITALSATITGLVEDTGYDVQVRATNAEGDSGWSPSGTGTTNAAATPTVSISADKTTAVFKEDAIVYTLTRTGSTTADLPVSVTLTQTKSFLLATDLTKTVTIAVGQSTNTFTVAASSFQHFAAGTTVEGGTLTATVQDGTDYDLGATSSVDVAIVIGVTVRFDQASYSVSEAAFTFSFKVIGRTRPGAPKPTSNSSAMQFVFTDGTAIENTDYHTIDNLGVLFGPSNYFIQSDSVWQGEDTFGISVTDDDLDEDDETFTLTLEYENADLDHTPLVDASGNSCGNQCTVTVTITDDDTAGVTVLPTALTVTEQDMTGDTYTVVLTSQPTANVTVTVAGHASTDVTPTPTTLMFTSTTWNTPQPVTVTAAHDADTVTDEVSLTHSATSSDTDYSSITIPGVMVTVNDNDTANTAPTFGSTTAMRNVPENTAAGQNVGGVLTATDSDDDTLTYTLEGTDAASFDLDTTTTAGSARIQTKTGVTYNHEAKSTYTVVVKADDGNSGTDTITVTITITDVDGEAPGRPAAPMVTATSGSTTSLDVSWSAPTNTGPAIDTYDLQYQKTTESTWTNGPQDQTGTNAAIGSLDAGTAYQVQVRATNDEGDSNWSQSGTGSTGTPATPTVSISADKTTAVFKEDAIVYTLTRTGSTTAALAVSVTLTQTKSFLLATELTKTVTIAVGQSTKTFTVAASSFQHFAAGTTVEGGTLTATVQDGTDYDLGTPASVDVAIVIGVMVRLEGAPLTNEGTASFTFKVIARTGAGAPQPSATTGIISVLTEDISATKNLDFGFVPDSWDVQPGNFLADGTRWEAEITYTVSIENDALDEGDETFNLVIERPQDSLAYSLVDASGNSCGTKCTVMRTIADNDTAGVTVSPTILTVTEEDTTGGTYTVVLDSQPTADVTVTVAGHASTDVTPMPTTLMFTSTTWATAQEVTVTAVDDGDTVNDEVTLTHSAASTDTDYSGITIAGVTVTVIDNDTANNAPVFADATANRSVAENTAAGQNVGGVLTATDSDGDTLTYTLEGTDAASFDLVTTTDPAAQIRTKAGVTYNHEVKPTYTVVVKADDGNSGIATVTVTEVGGSPTLLDVEWRATTTNTGPAIGDYDLRYKLQGTMGSWTNGPQDVIGTSARISGLDPGTEYAVQVRATSDEGDSEWSTGGRGTTEAPTTTAGVTVSKTSLTVMEQDTTGDTYTVVLDTEPTATVTVTVAGHASTEVTPTPTSLTFTTGNWNMLQPVTVTAANDDDTTNDTVTLTHSAMSTDGDYGGITIASVMVTVNDNDSVRTVTPPPPANGSPEFGASSATRSMEETVGDAGAETAVSVGAPVRAVDPEGDTIEYSLGGTDGDKFDIDGNTGQILGRVGERYDHEEKQSYEVTVSASDGEGGADTIEVTINIDNVSEAPEAPGVLRVRASGMTALGISWSAPRNAGRPGIEGYDLRYRNIAETEWSDGPGGVEETETDVPGLLEDTEYEVQVRAVNAEGAGEWSQAASGRTGVQPAGVAVAWLGRFGRTVAEHVLSGVSARITALRSSGMKAALGGLDLFPVESPDELPPGHEDREEFTDWFGEEEEDSFRFLTMAGNDIKTRSSFVLGRSSGGGFGAVWGSGAFGGFNGRESGVSFEGDVRTGMLGADYAVGGLVGGVALSRSVGEGSYRNGRGSGKVKSSVTGIYPYAGNELSEKFSVWAVAGYGRGGVFQDSCRIL